MSDGRRRVRRGAILASILRKDLLLFSRDWLFVALSIMSVATFVVLYYVLPADVQPDFSLGVRGSEFRPILERLAGPEEDGIPIQFFETTEEARAAVDDGALEVAIDFPDGMIESIRAGEPLSVTVFARPTFPGEYRTAVSTMVREIAFAVAGYELPVTEPAEETVVLGPSMGPMPLRDTMRPLYAFMVLIMEAIAISVLISSEVQQGTMTALLATPAGITDVLASKGLLGTAIAFSESALVLLLIRGLGASPGIVLVALLLGAVLVTGIAMIAGSAGKDLVGTMMIGMLMLIPLAVPAFAVLIPGSVAVWVQALPSYGLVKTVTDTSMGGAGWTDALPWLGVLAAWCVASGAIGVAVLRRRVRVL